MTLNINNILTIVAIFQSILLSIFFFQNKKGNILSNKILGAFLSVLAVTIIFVFTSSNNLGKVLIVYKYPVIFLTVEFNYLLGPLLYFYIKSLVDKDFKLKPVYIIHLIPYFIFSIISAFFLILEYFNYMPPFNMRTPDIIVMILHMFGYNILCIVTALKKDKINNLFSEESQTLWLRFMLLACTFLLLIKAIMYVVVLLHDKYNSFLYLNILIYLNAIYIIILFAFTYLVSFFILKKPETFSFTKKYQKSELKVSEIEEYKKKLICYIEESKIYLEPSLTITMLSKKISIPVPYLSRVINESFNLNFCDYINRYRVQESQNYLRNLPNTKKTILEIAYTVGFNSKSSFYDAFKKHTGITPTEFVKKTQ